MLRSQGATVSALQFPLELSSLSLSLFVLVFTMRRYSPSRPLVRYLCNDFEVPPSVLLFLWVKVGTRIDSVNGQPLGQLPWLDALALLRAALAAQACRERTCGVLVRDIDL